MTRSLQLQSFDATSSRKPWRPSGSDTVAVFRTPSRVFGSSLPGLSTGMRDRLRATPRTRRSEAVAPCGSRICVIFRSGFVLACPRKAGPLGSSADCR
jgi:hypothetical protein